MRLGAPSNNYVVHYVEQYANIPAGALEITISGHLQVRTDEPPDDVYDEASNHVTEDELVALTLAIVAVNGWNRLNIAFRMEAGNYRPGMFKHLLKSA